MRSTRAHHIGGGSNVSIDNLGEPHARVFRPTSAAVLKRGGGRESRGGRRENSNPKLEIRRKSEGGKIENRKGKF